MGTLFLRRLFARRFRRRRSAAATATAALASIILELIVMSKAKSTSNRAGELREQRVKTGRVAHAVVVLGGDARVRFHARVEHFVYIALRYCRALDVLVGFDFLTQLFAFACRYVSLFGINSSAAAAAATHAQLVRLARLAQVALRAHQNDYHARYELVELGQPFRDYIVHRVGPHNAETQYDYVGFRVSHDSKRVPVFLASGVVKIERIRFTIVIYTHLIIVYDGRTIVGLHDPMKKTSEQGRLAAIRIAH